MKKINYYPNIGKEVKNMSKKSKKGFTLIELIAVIAILAILGAILVPNIIGYRQKAQKSNLQTSAKTIQDAIETYNSDKDDADQIGDGSSYDYASGLSLLLNDEHTLKSVTASLSSYNVTTYASLQAVAKGNFKCDQNGNVTSVGH